MSSSISKKRIGALLTVIFISTAAICWNAYSQEASASKSPRAKSRGRLPAYYGDVITKEQRDKIYSIQASYEEQLAALREQLKALVAKRDAEVEAVLTPEQREQVKKIAEEARAERQAQAALKAASESETEPAAP